jgi:hypothetical protein
LWSGNGMDARLKAGHDEPGETYSVQIEMICCAAPRL